MTEAVWDLLYILNEVMSILVKVGIMVLLFILIPRILHGKECRKIK